MCCAAHRAVSMNPNVGRNSFIACMLLLGAFASLRTETCTSIFVIVIIVWWWFCFGLPDQRR